MSKGKQISLNRANTDRVNAAIKEKKIASAAGLVNALVEAHFTEVEITEHDADIVAGAEAHGITVEEFVLKAAKDAAAALKNRSEVLDAIRRGEDTGKNVKGAAEMRVLTALDRAMAHNDAHKEWFDKVEITGGLFADKAGTKPFATGCNRKVISAVLRDHSDRIATHHKKHKIEVGRHNAKVGRYKREQAKASAS